MGKLFDISEFRGSNIPVTLGVFAEVLDAVISSIEKMRGARTMTFHGPHDPAINYPAGAVVQRSGKAWVAMVATDETPGDSPQWRRLTD